MPASSSCFIEQLACRADERFPAEVFLISRLLTHKHHLWNGASALSKCCLCGVLPQIAGFAGFSFRTHALEGLCCYSRGSSAFLAFLSCHLNLRCRGPRPCDNSKNVTLRTQKTRIRGVVILSFHARTACEFSIPILHNSARSPMGFTDQEIRQRT